MREEVEKTLEAASEWWKGQRREAERFIGVRCRIKSSNPVDEDSLRVVAFMKSPYSVKWKQQNYCLIVSP